MKKLKKTYLAAALFAVMGSSASATDTNADIKLLVNADIITMNPAQPAANAIAYQDGLIVALGTEKEVRAVVGNKVDALDLDGKTLIPGLFETHDHLYMSSSVANVVDIAPFTSPTLASALEKLKAEAKVDSDGWVVAFGADQTLYEEKRGPHISELDALFPNTPVVVFHLSGHGGFFNSYALKQAGIDKNTANPEGGNIEKDEKGELTGYLSGQPALFMVTQYPIPSYETALLASQQRAALGITTASDLSIMNKEILETVSKVTADEDFAVRLVAGLFSTAPDFDKLASSLGDYENEMFKVPFVKTWTDGSIQGGTGHLTHGYHDHSYGTGGAQGSQEYFKQQMLDIYKHNLWPAFHANGDGATDVALNAIEHAQKATGNYDIRPQLIHSQYTRPEQIKRMAELGATPTFFTTHVYYWGDLHHDHTLGPERAQRLSAMKDAFDAGLPASMHNDKPVSDIDPFLNMQVSVMRESSSGRVIGADQAITPYQALQSYTINGAYQFGMENVAGSLEVGKYADMVILDKNPLTVAPSTLRDINVQATILGGKVTYTLSPAL